MVEAFSKTWVSILRCRPSMDWPDGILCPVFTSNAVTEANLPFSASLGVVSWASNDRNSEMRLDRSHFVHRDMLPAQADIRFTEGAPSNSQIKFKPTKAEAGELDIQFNVKAEQPLPYDYVHELSCAFCRFTQGYIGVVLGDILKPTGPIETFDPDSRSRNSPPFDAFIVRRIKFNAKHLSEKFREIAPSLTAPDTYSASERRAIGVAARRFFAAQDDPDPIGRYLEYWHACEFLCCRPSWQSAKKARDNAVADALTEYTDLKNAKVFPTIKDLYSVRGNLVHEAVENNPQFHKKLHLLKTIAAALLSFRYGLSDDGSVLQALEGVEIPGVGLIVTSSFGTSLMEE